MSDPQITSHNLQPVIAIIAEGETYEHGVSVGTSKYMIFFPRIKRMMGLELKVIASHSEKTRFEVKTTPLEESAEKIYQRMYGDK